MKNSKSIIILSCSLIMFACSTTKQNVVESDNIASELKYSKNTFDILAEVSKTKFYIEGKENANPCKFLWVDPGYQASNYHLDANPNIYGITTCINRNKKTIDDYFSSLTILEDGKYEIGIMSTETIENKELVLNIDEVLNLKLTAFIDNQELLQNGYNLHSILAMNSGHVFDYDNNRHCIFKPAAHNYTTKQFMGHVDCIVPEGKSKYTPQKAYIQIYDNHKYELHVGDVLLYDSTAEPTIN